MTYRRGDYALPPCDELDAAVVALGLIFEAADLPDEELTQPSGFPPINPKRKRPACGGSGGAK